MTLGFSSSESQVANFLSLRRHTLHMLVLRSMLIHKSMMRRLDDICGSPLVVSFVQKNQCSSSAAVAIKLFLEQMVFDICTL